LNKVDFGGLAGARPIAPPIDGHSAAQAPTGGRGSLPFGLTVPSLIFIVGLLALAIPTLIFVADSTWSTEQGTHGPIILATGLWLLWHKRASVMHLVDPPPAWRGIALFAVLVPVYAISRITQIVEIEGYAMYALALAAVYWIAGGRFIRALAFPLFYLAFVFPPPDTVIYAATLPVKIAIAKGAIGLLQFLGYPIGGSGVSIQIGQYQLLVAAACSGLNSIVTLSALALFSIYLMHQGRRRHQLLLILFVLPVAIAANFLRVLILILLTYHFGEAVAQSFLHDLAGITMFGLSIGMLYLVDRLLGRVVGVAPPRFNQARSAPA
jgi:exosortase